MVFTGLISEKDAARGARDEDFRRNILRAQGEYIPHMRVKRLEHWWRRVWIRMLVRLMRRPGDRRPNWDAGPSRVLFLRHDRVGDMIVSTGVMRAIARSHATISLDVLASPLNAGILDGDLVLVKPQQEATNGSIVVALVDGDATVKRFERGNGHVKLIAENPAYEPIVTTNVSLVGVVKGVIRLFR